MSHNRITEEAGKQQSIYKRRKGCKGQGTHHSPFWAIIFLLRHISFISEVSSGVQPQRPSFLPVNLKAHKYYIFIKFKRESFYLDCENLLIRRLFVLRDFTNSGIAAPIMIFAETKIAARASAMLWHLHLYRVARHLAGARFDLSAVDDAVLV